MSEQTLTDLDAAIRAHYGALLSEIDTHPVVTGWVLAVEVQTLEEAMTVWDNDYTMGETTSPNTAVGLVSWVERELEEALHKEYDEEDDS